MTSPAPGSRSTSARRFGATFGLLLALTLPALLGACATSARHDPPKSVVTLDEYSMAHGMALSFLTSGNAKPADLLEIVRLDRAAMHAVLAQAQAGIGGTATAQARRAIDALMDYASTHDMNHSVSPGAARIIVRPPSGG